MLIGGPELLLEVAFEVAFAGTLVRRLRHFQVVGSWKGRLLRSTAPFALAVMLGLEPDISGWHSLRTVTRPKRVSTRCGLVNL